MAKKVLVVANETVGGAKLIEKVREKTGEGDSLALVIPQSRPKSGNVIYLDAMFDAAEVRLSLARQFMAGEGVNIQGEVGDSDPFSAAMDGILEFQPDEVIVSTKPATVSGWLRRDLVERIRNESGLPVEHVVVDLEHEGLPFDVTLVVANKTVGESALLDRLREINEEKAHLFIVLVPQEHGGGHAVREARDRLRRTLQSLRDGGLLVAGMIGPPDPYDAAMTALQSFRVDDLVVSTLPATKSGWMRSDLIDRLKSATGKPVEHVVAQEAPASA
ncbi:MAG: hypothetical protein QOF49_683 [Chloroflexota bacterium]|nr:hypothetical protein [Chloroflexota bacterium]